MFHIILTYLLYWFNLLKNYIFCIKKNNLVVNYHFLRSCNYECKFCFHTNKDEYTEPLGRAKKGLTILKNKGISRINFSGGEPFLKAKLLGEMCKFCKTNLKMQVSIVSNGSLIKKEWFNKYGKYLDVIAISCDSFNPDTLKKIGRYQNRKDHIWQLRNIREWCYEYNIKFKINTVVCSVNKDEILVDDIRELNPCRWKVFQCLLIDGENIGDTAIKDARKMVVSNNEFNTFIENNKINCLVPENNNTMRNSYLILDERMRFLNNTTGAKIPSISILQDINKALKDSGFDLDEYKKRDGEWCNTNKKVSDIEDLFN